MKPIDHERERLLPREGEMLAIQVTDYSGWTGAFGRPQQPLVGNAAPQLDPRGNPPGSDASHTSPIEVAEGSANPSSGA